MVTSSVPRLVLTGERRKRHFLVMIHGHPVWLSAALFTALCELVLGRHGTTSGFVPIACQTIYRLRKAINHAQSNHAFDIRVAITTGRQQCTGLHFYDGKRSWQYARSAVRAGTSTGRAMGCEPASWGNWQTSAP